MESRNLQNIAQKNGTACVRHTHTFLACQDIILSFSISFLPKNACKKNPCKNNATCQAGFTDRDYQCLCVDGSGFKGHDCDEGKESYTFISIANHMISSEIWGKSARSNCTSLYARICCAGLTP